VLIKSNHVFHRLLLEGVKVDFKIDGEGKTDYVALLDFATVSNNQFLVVNQYTLASSKGYPRPDVLGVCQWFAVGGAGAEKSGGCQLGYLGGLSAVANL
jgi:hypothetical protein